MKKTIEITLSEEQLKKWEKNAKINNLDLEHWVYEACNRYLMAPNLIIHEIMRNPHDWLYGLSTRASICLLSGGYKNREEVILKLSQNNDRDFLQIPNLGKGSLKEIKDWAALNSEYFDQNRPKIIEHINYLDKST